MSDADKKYNENSSEDSVKDGTVEAFEDFEMTAESTGSIPEVIEETDCLTEETDTSAEEAEAGETEADGEITEGTSEEAETDEAEEAAEADEAVETDEADEAVETDETEEAAEADEAVETDEAEEAAEADEAVETDEAEESAEADEAVETDEAEESAEADEAVETDEAEEVAETDEAVETDEAEEAAEADEAVETDEAEEAAETDEAVETDEAEEVEEIDEIGESGEADEVEEVDETDEVEEIDEVEEPDETDEVEEIDEIGKVDEAENSDEIDEDDYLDYDDGPRQKKIVSGKTAVITMLVTCFVTIGLIATAFWLGVTLQKDTGVSVVSFADRFNACDINDFSLGKMISVETISFSDEERSFSQQDIRDLKSGKTVTKFDNLVNIKADTRFGKIVSMDISFNKGVDDVPDSTVNSLLLLGSSLSGLFDNIDSGNMAFLFSYNASVINCIKWPDKGENVFYYQTDGIVIYTDHSKRMETGNVSDLKVHVENADTNYIHMNRLDFSWLPFDFSKDSENAGHTEADTTTVSSSDKVSETDN